MCVFVFVVGVLLHDSGCMDWPVPDGLGCFSFLFFVPQGTLYHHTDISKFSQNTATRVFVKQHRLTVTTQPYQQPDGWWVAEQNRLVGTPIGVVSTAGSSSYPRLPVFPPC